MAGSITSVNAVVTLTIPNLFPIPQQLQNFSADDIYDFDDIEVAETAIGVDGQLAGGLVLSKVVQKFYLMADSSSVTLFDTWRASQNVIRDVYIASGQVTLTSIGRKYICTGGFLTRVGVASSAKKVLQRRTFEVVWESVIAQNASATAF